jgi:hypothetical protein
LLHLPSAYRGVRTGAWQDRSRKRAPCLYLPLPPAPGGRAHRGRYVTTRLTKHFPSPSTGEGGGESTAPLPPVLTFPHQGEGTFTYPSQRRERGNGWHGERGMEDEAIRRSRQTYGRSASALFHAATVVWNQIGIRLQAAPVTRKHLLGHPFRKPPPSSGLHLVGKPP